MRVALAVLLVLIGAAAVVISVGPLSNLFAGYQDSPASTYLLVGLPPLLLGVAALVAAWRLLKS
jgi:hypothetical protein